MKTVMTKVADWTNRLAGARSAMEELRGADAELRREHAAALAERTRVIGLSPPLADIIGAMRRLVDEHAQQWAERNGPGLVRAFGPGLKESGEDGSVSEQKPSMPDMFWTAYGNLPVRDMNPSALAGLAPDLMKTRLEAVIRATPYDAGPPIADRPALLAELDAKIRDIEQRHTELVDGAAAFDPPITLALLPAVAARRQEEAYRQKRNAAADAARREREEAVNRQHAQAVERTGRSEYLATVARHRAELRN